MDDSMSLVQSVQRQGEQPGSAPGNLLAPGAGRRLSPLRSYEPCAVLARDPVTRRSLTVQLPTGHAAEYMRTRSDCLRAALSTLANRPYAEVPAVPPEGSGGPHATAQGLADLGGWARSLGYRLVWHEMLPLDRGAWVGGIPADEHGPSHALVMCRDRVVHDPARGYPMQPGEEWIPGSLDQVTFAITLEPVLPVGIEVWRPKAAA